MKKVMFVIISFFIFIVNINAVEVKSENMVLYNLNDDIMLEEKNKDEKISIASMTKIMTVIVAIEHIDDLNQKVKMTEDVFNGLEEENASLSGFTINQTVTYEDLLYGTLLPSGADAAVSLAVNLAGSKDAFVKLMNKKVEELGLRNTHFTNVTGLDEDNHYSSVNDVAVMLKYSLKDALFKKIFTSKSYMTSDRKLTIYSTLTKSLSSYRIDADYIMGGKTGYTLDAGRCLASIAYDESNDLYYLLVTAKAPITTSYYHLTDAKTIYEHYFESYSYHTLIKKDDVLYTIKTKNAKEKKYDIIATETVKKYFSNDFDKSLIELKYNGIEVVKSNAKVGSKLGSIDILYKGEVIDTIEVTLDSKLHFSLFQFLKSNIVIVLLVMGILYYSVKFKNKKRMKKRQLKKRIVRR